MTGLPHVGLYRRATAAALLLAPALFLLDNIIHPTEYERENEARQLAEIAAHHDRWQLAHALGFLSIVVFAAAVLGLAFLVRRRQPRLGLWAGALGVTGLLGLAAVITIDGYAWGVLGDVYQRQGVSPETVALALTEVQQSDWSLIYYLTPLAWIAGIAMLALGAARQGAVPAWAGALLALGGLMVGIETAVISNAYFIAAAAVLAAGAVAVGLVIARMSDEAFARGG
ncbi:MAG: DUF4386 family protein [Solirubrobacterales bacterium]